MLGQPQGHLWEWAQKSQHGSPNKLNDCKKKKKEQGFDWLVAILSSLF